MKQTRVSRLFGIRLPIVQGGMAWVSRSGLAAAVSEAGGLGLIGASTMVPGELAEEVRACRALTASPFGVNLSLTPVRPDAGVDDVFAMVEAALAAGVRIFFTAAGSPARLTPRLKEAGAVVVHVVSSPRQAAKAVAAGVDAVVAEGYEAGGHIGADELTTLVLVPIVRRAVSVPVIAAGGIVCGRGIAAAFALGAEAAQLGTRFVATTECEAHAVFKMALLRAGDVATAVYGRRHHPSRALRTAAVKSLLELERAGASVEEVERVRGRGRAQAGCVGGDDAEGIFPCGAGAALIDETKPVALVMRELVEGYRGAVEGLP